MSIIWNTGPNRGQFKQQPKNKKLIKKYHDAWAKANGYKPQASSSKRQAASRKRLVYDVDTLQVLGYYRKEKC